MKRKRKIGREGEGGGRKENDKDKRRKGRKKGE